MRRERLGVLVGILAAGLAAGPSAGTAAAVDGKVRVLTSGNRSERVSSIPITGRPGAESRRIFAIAGKRMVYGFRGDVMGKL